VGGKVSPLVTASDQLSVGKAEPGDGGLIWSKGLACSTQQGNRRRKYRQANLAAQRRAAWLKGGMRCSECRV